jgi:hypothetical protein
MPGDRTLLCLDASLAILTCVVHFEVSGSRRCTPVRPVPTSQTGLTYRSDWSSAVVLRSSVMALWLNQGTQWFYGEPLETPRTRCSLRPIPTQDLAPTSSRLDLGFEEQPRKTIHDFVLLFLPPCDPHFIPLAIKSLEPCLLVCSTPGGLTYIDLSHLFFTSTSTTTNQIAACTCNT